MPGDGLTHGPPAKEKLAAKTTGAAGSSGIPCAMVLTLSFALSLGTGLSCPHHRADYHPHNLASASGCQDHTTSASAALSLVLARSTRPPLARPTSVTVATPL